MTRNLVYDNFLPTGSFYGPCHGLSCIILNGFKSLLKRPFKSLIADNIIIIEVKLIKKIYRLVEEIILVKEFRTCR